MAARGLGGSKTRGSDPLLESMVAADAWPPRSPEEGTEKLPRRKGAHSRPRPHRHRCWLAAPLCPMIGPARMRGSTHCAPELDTAGGAGLPPRRDGYQSTSIRIDRPARAVWEMTDTRRLPKPVAHEWDWQLNGSCQGLNSSVFFHPDGERGSARSRRADRAKAICQHCPVLEQCRRYALAAREPYGVWGGLTEEERREHLSGQHQLLVS
jgi:WhiB family transcriptional regulator, redox-sensing transcriptional regulator